MSEWIGGDAHHIVWWQSPCRHHLLYGLAIIRVFGRKAFGKQSPIDIVLAIVIGSNLSRTLTATAPLLPTLAATLVLVLCYWSVGQLAARWNMFSRLVKGDPITLVQEAALTGTA